MAIRELHSLVESISVSLELMGLKKRKIGERLSQLFNFAAEQASSYARSAASEQQHNQDLRRTERRGKNSPYSRSVRHLYARVQNDGKRNGSHGLSGGKDFQNGIRRGQLDERNVNRAIFKVESGSIENVFEKKRSFLIGEKI